MTRPPIKWGPAFKGSESIKKFYKKGDWYRWQCANPVYRNENRWSYPENPERFAGLQGLVYCFPEDHPYYQSPEYKKSLPKPPEEAAVDLLTELGYTGITPPVVSVKDREFVADMWTHVYGKTGSAPGFRQGRFDDQAKKFIEFIRANKDRL